MYKHLNIIFQSKLQEDYDTVQTMLEEKQHEIESLSKDLLELQPPGETYAEMQVMEKQIGRWGA